MNILGFIERYKFSLMGVFATYAGVLIWANWFVIETVIPPRVVNEEVIAILDFSEEEIPEEKVDPENIPSETNQPMSNVAANVNQEKTTYTNTFSKSQADQEVWNELKQLEANEFNMLSNDNPDLVSKEQSDEKDINPNLVDKNAEKNENAGYGMDIVATVYYKLDNRSALKEKKPSYLCKSEGIVRVNIKVNQKGQVVTVDIDESNTNTSNECLRNAALEYGKLWKFNQDFNDEIRKQGWIEFRYEAQ